MKLALILDPLTALKPDKDSSIAMMREAAKRGHALWSIQRDALMWREGVVSARATALALSDKRDRSWYRAGPTTTMALTEFDAVLMRQDPPFDFEYITATWLLERAEGQGARVYNRPRAVRDHSEKIAITEFPQFAPTTLVARDPAELDRFIDEIGDVILKPLDGMGGSGIFRVTRNDPNRNVIIETVAEFGSRTVMAQRYIAEITEGDKRILLIAGEPVPYVLARVPKPGESRGNLAVGGTGIVRPLSDRDRRMAETLGPILHGRGLLLVGLDVIGDHLTEINVTSPTCFVEIQSESGYDVSGQFIDALEAAIAGERDGDTRNAV